MQNHLSSALLSKTVNIKIYRSIILPIVLYGYETWSVTLKEERRLRVSENRVLRRIFGPKRDEVTEEWKKVYNEEHNDLHSSRNNIWVIKSRITRLAGHVARVRKRRGAYRVLIWKPVVKRPLGRPRRRFEDNNKMDLEEVKWVGMDWIHLAQDRDRWRALVHAVMNRWVP